VSTGSPLGSNGLHPRLIDLSLDRLHRIAGPETRPPGTAPATHYPRRRHQRQRQHLRLLRAMAEAAGHARARLHLAASVAFNERIRVAGELVSDAG
jgi:dihydrofolate synthase/folylpolyglutamate synthase